MGLNEYLDSLKGKRVAVIGIGVSNTPLIELLLGYGISVTACDKKERGAFGDLADRLEKWGCRLQLGETYLQGLDQDVIFRSPGIRPDIPEFLAAAQRGSTITSEMEVFFDVCPCHTIGVTGSDGKTTTTTIIAELLKAAGKTVYVGGNIGHPLLSEVTKMKNGDYAVLELSSFQLLTMEKSPEIAVVTNLAPNHLNVHKGMEEYVRAKANIFLHQNVAQKVILNYDNDLTRAFADQAPGKVVFFSRKDPQHGDVVLRDDVITVKEGASARAVLPVRDIAIPGVHNVENYMAAVAAVDGLVDDEVIRTVAASFAGVEHRIELVRELHGVRYYNDSIASSPTRTIAGLRSFRQKVILIAGGKDKDIPYDALGPEIVEHVKFLVLTGGDVLGSTVPKICTAVLNAPGYHAQDLPVLFVDDFDKAVQAAAAHAQEGDVVLLSPASTSFDKFANFMERGNRFKAIVNHLE
ncbi:MAG TPA: UDP-N-acetylmuramoyl-L-alanine--D-glutamate ligase [Firmicutes bacterium]|nr:UDP-N-acetylmuramoyl-L-alanine--D-glutamate ligase [Bacillota bacterium]